MCEGGSETVELRMSSVAVLRQRGLELYVITKTHGYGCRVYTELLTCDRGHDAQPGSVFRVRCSSSAHGCSDRRERALMLDRPGHSREGCYEQTTDHTVHHVKLKVSTASVRCSKRVKKPHEHRVFRVQV